jgi:hypothetical protein
MPNGDLLKQLFRNYKSSNNPGFEAVAQQIIVEERQKNHHVLANDLQRILANESVAARRNGHVHPLPRNQEEDAGLLEIRHPDKYWSDLIISKVGCSFVARSLVVKR